MDDLDRAISTKEMAFFTDTAPPSIRIRAASSCSNLLFSQGRYKQAKPILEAAVRLLPTISPRTLKRRDQQFNISQFSNITSQAVSLCLADGEDEYKSLQLLELGRGILTSLQLEVRSDISVLAASHPDFARQFLQLRNQIDPPSGKFDSSLAEESSDIFNSTFVKDSSRFIAERRALFTEFDDLLRDIRSLDGFGSFLRGPSESEMRSLAEGGAIIEFNVSDIRSDAFLITTDRIRSVHLPLLTSKLINSYAQRFLYAINNQNLRQYSQALNQMNVVLKGLWDFAVKSILDELGFTQMPSIDERWPRVWWIGSNVLNILPIHASGYHNSTPSQTTLDRVISSYAFSIKSLAYARERAFRTNQSSLKDSAIVVAMPITPGQKNLPSVDIEVKELENLLFKAFIDSRVMQTPTRMEVLSTLSRYTMVHFACHGYCADDPSQSSLLLKDGSLTVADLASLNIDSAKFAYLSACHTSTMRNFNLLDESISLSSAIQLCGYPSIVGSLWQVGDNLSSDIARNIYEWILDESGFDFRRTAEGLHRAVRDLRDMTRFASKTDPLIWASFIYIGI
jgi:CHAT domain-containing protein